MASGDGAWNADGSVGAPPRHLPLCCKTKPLVLYNPYPVLYNPHPVLNRAFGTGPPLTFEGCL